MAKVLVVMNTALQKPTALPCADMFRFELVSDGSRRRVEWPLLTLGALSLNSLAFSRTTTLVAIVATATEPCPTSPHAIRRLFLALVANCLVSRAAAAA